VYYHLHGIFSEHPLWKTDMLTLIVVFVFGYSLADSGQE
jgi:hypothetical protein